MSIVNLLGPLLSSVVTSIYGKGFLVINSIPNYVSVIASLNRLLLKFRFLQPKFLVLEIIIIICDFLLEPGKFDRSFLHVNFVFF